MTAKLIAKLPLMGIELPNTQPPVGNYIPAVITGNQIYVAGQLCIWNGEIRHRGQLGKEISLATGQEAARLCGLNVLGHLLTTLGELERVKRCVKLNAFVRSAPTFTDQPKVADGASDLMVQVFGEAGRHARSAVGVAQLPLGVCVEIDALFEIAN